MMERELYQRYMNRQIKRDLIDSDGTLLLKKGSILTESILSKLKVGIEKIEMVTQNSSTRQGYQRLITGTTNEIRDIFRKIQSNKQEINQIELSILPTVEELAQEQKLSILLEGILGKDDYTYRHNIGVAILSSMLARWLRFSEGEIQFITLGGLLHDVGKLYIDDYILTKPGKLTTEEYEAIKEHALFGYQILCNHSMYSKEICLMALEHHEREDGSGYPDQKTADEIHRYSKIIAIADVFHAMTSDRVYRKGMALYDVLRQMKEEAFGKLEPTYVSTFIQKLMELSIGNKAILSNGRVAEVVFIFADEPFNPLVRLDQELVDLRKSEWHIQQLLSID
ncbi:HD-GYP domain-containing protein [Halalkalibacter alkalisediminis]|uniref:HD-GYP domain-containing protein n=1 Tax=Halalkalibacter alkalisediminis TaxID=935616 RepID=A0ABV6NK12_9BACI|nr:HD-GYP domain-containing protein [Halalkalibacter alkalisediminis]